MAAIETCMRLGVEGARSEDGTVLVVFFSACRTHFHDTPSHEEVS
jgi:hypothetical protein